MERRLEVLCAINDSRHRRRNFDILYSCYGVWLKHTKTKNAVYQKCLNNFFSDYLVGLFCPFVKFDLIKFCLV